MIANDDELYCQTPAFLRFVTAWADLLARHDDRDAVYDALRAPFAVLLAEETWLPPEFAVPADQSGMGGGIGSYLLYRTAARDRSISALVVPAGSATPVHDHLARGLVGLYRGEQDEEVFRPVGGSPGPGRAPLELVERRHLRPGDFYDLRPPIEDIHRVRSRPEAPSISIHVLANDVGCVHRHAYDPDAGTVRDFRTGYSNVTCPEEAGADAGTGR